MIDFHSHLVPGVDDGAATLEQSRDALRAMCEQGVHTVVTTPHLSGALTERPADLAAYFATLDPAWERLSELAAREFPELRLERGVEVMLDTPTPDLSDPRVRLAGTSYVLVEFPFMNVPPNGPRAVFELKVRGVRPIIAHPERYRNLTGLEAVDDWRSVGALLQVNAGSLTGRYGEAAQRLAWALVQRGWVDFLGSDYHARGRVHLEAARRALLERGGEAQAQLLLEENAARLLRGEDPVRVPPLPAKRPLWRRVLGLAHRGGLA